MASNLTEHPRGLPSPRHGSPGDESSPPPAQGCRAPGGEGSSSLLARAWRAAAEAGPPAMTLSCAECGPTVLWVNRALVDLLGSTSSLLVGRALDQLAGVGADPMSESAWNVVAAELITGRGGQREAGVQRPDGSDVRVQLDASNLSETPGSLDGWLIAIHPLTDAQADQAAALREADHRFRALAESAPVGILVSEAGLRLGYVNEWFCDLTARARHQLLGTEWLDAVVAEDLPVVYAAVEQVLTGTPQELNLRVAGAGDTPRWVHLSLAPTTTSARAAGFIGTAEDVTDRRAWEEKITYQARHDPLTGLVNRRRLIELLHETLESRRSFDRHFAVVFLDLDGFKQINDSHGHEAGDRVLVEVARRMRGVARDYDIVGRISGDEFVLVLRNVPGPMDAEAAARRQLEALEAPIRIGSSEVRLSASIGVVLPSGEDTPETLLKAADALMYQAKSAGGHRFVVARLVSDPPPDHELDHVPDQVPDQGLVQGPGAVSAEGEVTR
ncbi:MAG: diguanylate cyclase [Kineosporiaceae bacterium]|nr:diguanylate cyclase [Kineosporiaceae bacterium]